MAEGELYLDNSATTQPLPAVAQTVKELLAQEYGNPSSLHRMGLQAERRIKEARQAVAQLLGVPPASIVFTSGATEANNMAIRGAVDRLQRWGRHIVTSVAEHSSVLETCRALAAEGFEVTELAVDNRGLIEPARVREAVRSDTILVSLMLVNNELGTITPIAQVGRLVRELREKGQYPYFHVDAVQAVGKVYVNPQKQLIDLLTLSGHKLGGPKGVGALYVAEGVQLEPLMTGGDQERGLRPGTENVPAIAGLGIAFEHLQAHWQQEAEFMQKLRQRLLQQLRERIDGVKINGPLEGARAAPHIVNVSFPGIRGELIVHHLETHGIYVSTGSACHSRAAEASHVLRALELADDELEGAIRISFSPRNTPDEVDVFVDKLQAVVTELRQVVGRH